jgi:hypothetical protein
MRVLFDNGTPRGVAAALADHIVEEARSRGWDTLKNGELLDAAEAAGFNVFVTTDRNIRQQQKLAGRKIAIRCQQMQKKNGQIAHRTILPRSRHQEMLRTLALRHAQLTEDARRL